MAAGSISVTTLGSNGVNVDKNPLQLGDSELISAQNATVEFIGGRATLRKRPGFIEFTAANQTNVILGGIGVPLANKLTGTRLFYIGRGAV